MTQKKKVWLLLLAIALLGFFLRAYKLGAYSLVADEFLDMNSTYGYLKTGSWQAWNFNFGRVNTENLFAARDERAWIYKWQAAQVLRFLPATEAVARSVSVLWGVASIFAVYFAATYFTKKRVAGLLGAFLFAVSASAIVLDRKFRMYAMFFPVFLLFSWATYRFLEEEYRGKVRFLRAAWNRTGLNFLWILPSALLGILSLHLHALTVNIIAVVALYLSVRFASVLAESRSIKNKYAALLAAFFGTGALAYFLAPAKAAEYLGGLKFFADSYSYFSLAVEDYAYAPLAVAFFAGGAFWLARTGKEKEAAWLASSFLGILAMAIFFWRRNAGMQYIFFAGSFSMILISAGIFALADFLRRNLAGHKKKAFALAILASILILPKYAYFWQEQNAYAQKSDSENPDFRRIFSYLEKRRLPGDVLVTRNFRNYYWAGENVTVFDFGGELAQEKLSRGRLEEIVRANPRGWVVLPDNDEAYVKKDALEYMENNFKAFSGKEIGKNTKVYSWGN